MGRHQVCSRGLEFVDQFVPSHEADRSNATQLRNRDQRPADAGISSILNDPIAGLEVHIFAEDQRCRGWVAAELRELQPITVR